MKSRSGGGGPPFFVLLFFIIFIMEKNWLTIQEIHEMMRSWDSDLWKKLYNYFCWENSEQDWKLKDEVIMWLLEAISEKSWKDWDYALRSYIYNAGS